jgi:hypothetical protein
MSEERKTYKISASLINSYLNMRAKRYPNSEQQFADTLKRIPLKDSYALKRGNAFEKDVLKYESEPFHEIIKDCDTQVYVEKNIPLAREEFDLRLVGFVDFATKDRKIIYDTKRVNAWSDEKYDSSVQHDFYLWAVPESEKFFYLVGSGSKWRSDEYFEVEYGKPESNELEKRCLDAINDFIDYLKKNDLLDIYKKHFDASYKKKK